MEAERELLRDDLQQLKVDFERLWQQGTKTYLTIRRDYWPHRSPPQQAEQPGPGYVPTPNGTQFQTVLQSGLRVRDRPPADAVEAKHSPVFYDEAGSPMTSATGESLVAAAGWSDFYTIGISRDDNGRTAETLELANELASRHSKTLCRLLGLERVERIGSFWPAVVHQVAELTGRCEDWQVVLQSGNRFTVEAWQSRHQLGSGPYTFTEADEQFIGDHPAKVYRHLDKFLQRSEYAAQWLLKRLDEQAPSPTSQQAGARMDANIREAYKTAEQLIFKLQALTSYGDDFQRHYPQREAVFHDMRREAEQLLDDMRNLSKVFEQIAPVMEATNPQTFEAVGMKCRIVCAPLRALLGPTRQWLSQLAFCCYDPALQRVNDFTIDGKREGSDEYYRCLTVLKSCPLKAEPGLLQLLLDRVCYERELLLDKARDIYRPAPTAMATPAAVPAELLQQLAEQVVERMVQTVPPPPQPQPADDGKTPQRKAVARPKRVVKTIDHRNTFEVLLAVLRQAHGYDTGQFVEEPFQSLADFVSHVKTRLPADSTTPSSKATISRFFKDLTGTDKDPGWSAYTYRCRQGTIQTLLAVRSGDLARTRTGSILPHDAATED